MLISLPRSRGLGSRSWEGTLHRMGSRWAAALTPHGHAVLHLSYVYLVPEEDEVSLGFAVTFYFNLDVLSLSLIWNEHSIRILPSSLKLSTYS